MPAMALHDYQDEKPAPIAPPRSFSPGSASDLKSAADGRKRKVRWASNLVTYEASTTVPSQSMQGGTRSNSKEKPLSSHQRTAKQHGTKIDDVNRGILTPPDDIIQVDSSNGQQHRFAVQHQPEWKISMSEKDPRKHRRSGRRVLPFVPEPPSRDHNLKAPLQAKLSSPELSCYADSSFCACYENKRSHSHGSSQYKQSKSAEREEKSMSQKMDFQCATVPVVYSCYRMLTILVSAARDYIQRGAPTLPAQSKRIPRNYTPTSLHKTVENVQTQIMFDDFVLFDDYDAGFRPYIDEYEF